MDINRTQGYTFNHNKCSCDSDYIFMIIALMSLLSDERVTQHMSCKKNLQQTTTIQHKHQTMIIMMNFLWALILLKSGILFFIWKLSGRYRHGLIKLDNNYFIQEMVMNIISCTGTSL